MTETKNMYDAEGRTKRYQNGVSVPPRTTESTNKPSKKIANPKKGK